MNTSVLDVIVVGGGQRHLSALLFKNAGLTYRF